MDRIFYRKWTSILFVAAVLIVVLLVCMLLTTLTQMSSLNARAEKLNVMIENAQKSEAAKQELLEYLKTDEYVMKWAIENGRIHQDDISWVEQQK